MRETSMSHTFVLGVLLASCFITFSLAKTGSIVTQKDRDTTGKAGKKALDNCKGERAEINKDAKKDLIAASGDNWVLNQMKGAKDNDEFAKNMENNIDAGFVVAKGGPIVASILFIVAYCLCCWTACPCCKCCRVCKKKREIPKMAKFVGFGALGGIVLGIVIAAGMSRTGFDTAIAGFKDTSCYGAKLLNTTLAGSSKPYFLGMVPTLDVFDELIGSLDSDSKFITDLQVVLTNTKDIEHAVTIASGTMELLKDMMASPANTRPKTAASVDMLHECTLCPQLVKVLTPAIKELDEGIAVQLKSARAEVEKQLTGPALKDLQKSTKSGTEPLKELMSLMIQSFGFIVDGDDMTNLTDTIDKFGLYACLVLILVALLLSLFACCGMSLWTCRELKPGSDAPSEVIVGVENEVAAFAAKYRSHVHRISACTWCCGCYFIWFALFVGGLMTALSVPLASICLILDDVNSEMLTEIGGVLPVNFTGDSGTQMKDMIDKCFRNPDKSANPFLLDIIFTRNKTSNEKITMRTTIVNTTRDAINAQFDGITAQMSSGSGTAINTAPNIVKLKNTLRDTKMDAMMVPATDINWAASAYKDMGLDARSSNQLVLFYASSGSCDDFTVPADLGRLSGNNVDGIKSFATSLTFFGARIPDVTCAEKVLCADGAGTVKGKACIAANNFMTLKKDLRTANTFKCRKFQKDDGSTCDVMGMVEVIGAPGTYTGDCLRADGTMKAKEYDCTLAEFTTLTSQFNDRLDKVFKRMDGAAAVSMTKINVDMRKLVNENIIDRITTVAEGLTCGFLGVAYQEFIDAACYAGVWGFTQISASYVACGVLTLILVIKMYFVWRISIDNFNSNFAVAKVAPEA